MLAGGAEFHLCRTSGETHCLVLLVEVTCSTVVLPDLLSRAGAQIAVALDEATSPLSSANRITRSDRGTRTAGRGLSRSTSVSCERRTVPTRTSLTGPSVNFASHAGC